jgi:hypothetical protein
MTPTEWVRQTWTPETAPYNYTPAGVWVRRAMPDKGYMLGPRLLAVLADYAERMQGELHDEFRAERDRPAEDLAQLILALALIEDGTPFYTLMVEPTGRVWMTYRMQRFASWHPNAPRPVSP